VAGSSTNPTSARPSATSAPAPAVSSFLAPGRRLWATGYAEAAGGSRTAMTRRAGLSGAELRALVAGPERVVAWRVAGSCDGPEPVVFPSGELEGRWFVADDPDGAVRLALQAAVADRGRCLGLTTRPDPDGAG
jgi:hypothetical protein